MSENQPNALPLNLGNESQFTLARNFFKQCSFDEPTLCRLLGMDDMSDLGKVPWEKIDHQNFSPSLWACIEIFLRGNFLHESDLLAAWGMEVVSTLRSLGLIRTWRKAPEGIFCPVWLYPVQGFLIVSDRRTRSDG